MGASSGLDALWGCSSELCHCSAATAGYSNYVTTSAAATPVHARASTTRWARARGVRATIKLSHRHLTEGQMALSHLQYRLSLSHTHALTHARTQKPSACTYPPRRVSVRHGQRPEQPRAAEERGGCGKPLAALLMDSDRLSSSGRRVPR